MFARFDENPAMTLEVIKKKKTLRTDGRTHGQRENSIPHHKQSLQGIKTKFAGDKNKVCVGIMNRNSPDYQVLLQVGPSLLTVVLESVMWVVVGTSVVEPYWAPQCLYPEDHQ